MTITEAFRNISKRKFYARCGYRYCSFSGSGHDKLKFDDLPPVMREGVIDLIIALFRVQKMVYSYDLDFVCQCLQGCGVKLTGFFNDCDINKNFYRNRNVEVNRVERLMAIRLEIMRMINRLFEYVLT